MGRGCVVSRDAAAGREARARAKDGTAARDATCEARDARAQTCASRAHSWYASPCASITYTSAAHSPKTASAVTGWLPCMRMPSPHSTSPGMSQISNCTSELFAISRFVTTLVGSRKSVSCGDILPNTTRSIDDLPARATEKVSAAVRDGARHSAHLRAAGP